MRPVIMLALFFLVAVPAHAQEVKFPKDGNGMLEFCGSLVASFDSPPSQTGSTTEYLHSTFNRGWCAGYLHAMRETIVFWQLQVAKTVAVVGENQNPPAEELKQMVSKSPDMTCIPNEVNLAQMARILVKWLRDHPERLHESAIILTLDAFHDAFPCHADTKKPGK